MALATLGLALLEIENKRRIASYRTSWKPHDMVTACKLVDFRPTKSGAPYQAIFRNCMDCNFALEADMSKKGPQSAVYSGFVCSLEQLIRILEEHTSED
ncbi:hypothetical protein DM02DRAFT_687942 [Neofusicoccum parvum]|nr:hypothetical protein DM02DRAFT_687942 [Neofusicoccum parvum]